MPIAKEILNMLDLGRKPSQVISVVFLHGNWQNSQRISVPTVRLLLIINYRSVRTGFGQFIGGV